MIKFTILQYIPGALKCAMVQLVSAVIKSGGTGRRVRPGMRGVCICVGITISIKYHANYNISWKRKGNGLSSSMCSPCGSK